MIQSTVTHGGSYLPDTANSLPRQSYGVQAKLKVSQPGDAMELEADKVAQGVMDADSGSAAPQVQRKCAVCEGGNHGGNKDRRPEETVQRQAEDSAPSVEEEGDEEAAGGEISAKLIQRMPGNADPINTEQDEERIDSTIPREAMSAGPAVASGNTAAHDTAAAGRIGSVVRQSGQPLADGVRESLTPHFGEKLSGVRVHTDAGAAQSAQAIGARAFTLGRNIVFNSGEYQPHSQTGRRLLAHELAHVRQQGGL